MFWVLKSVADGIKDEYRGWHRFRLATGMWPVCSILASIFSMPACFASGTYFLIAAFETRRLPLIYAGLFTVVISSAAVWYGLRRLACKVDAARAKRSSETPASAETLEQLIR